VLPSTRTQAFARLSLTVGLGPGPWLNLNLKISGPGPGFENFAVTVTGLGHVSSCTFLADDFKL
jgi:hypothetical protein